MTVVFVIIIATILGHHGGAAGVGSVGVNAVSFGLFCMLEIFGACTGSTFLGIGIAAPMPTWGSLAADGLTPGLNPLDPRWWALLFPCILLVITLLSLNFLGDGLRDLLDPKSEAAKI